MVRIRRAEEGDFPALADVFARAATYLVERFRPEQVGVFSVDPDERMLLYRHLHATGVIFVAEDPEPVGFSAAVVRDGVWFLSQLWVLPDRHAGGIGSTLLDEALAWGKGCRAFSVVSSPHPAAQLMYLRASMFPLWVQHEMTGSDEPVDRVPEGIDSLGDDDLSWIDELDRAVRGVARPEDHRFWRGHAKGVVLRRDGRPSGYVYVWPNGKVGPGAVRDAADVPSLVRAARHVAGGAVSFVVPSSNWSALNELVRSGFSPFGSTTFMASRPIADGSRYLSGGGALG
jgi:GNAT superfamily N-acetyltransferase